MSTSRACRCHCGWNAPWRWAILALGLVSWQVISGWPSPGYSQETEHEKSSSATEDSAASVDSQEHAAGEHAAGTEGAAEQHAGEHHDPFDLSEHNASATLSEASELRFDQVLGSMAVFGLLLILLWKLAWGPITKGLDAREESIKNMIDEAQRNHEAAAARLREYESRLLAAAEESRAIIGQAQKDAEVAAQRIKDDAEATAERERSRAIADIQAAKAAALDEVAQKSVDMAVRLAGRLIQKQLNPSDHAQLINEALEQFPSRN